MDRVNGCDPEFHPDSTEVSRPTKEGPGSEYAAGLSSCLRIIYSQRQAKPDKKQRVFRNQAAEIATFVRYGGVDKIEAGDLLAGAAEAIGLDADVATAIMAEAIPSAPAISTPSPMQGKLSAGTSPSGDRTLVTCNLSDVFPEKIEWLWPGRIAVGKIALIAGEPGLGKSQTAIYVASAVTRGDRWTDGKAHAPLGSVVILSAEDGLADTIRPRFDAAGGDPGRVTVVRAVEARESGRPIRGTLDLAADMALLEQVITQRGDVRLVIIDPISSYMGRTDSHKNSDVRSVLEPIGEMAERLRVAVLAITHLSKNDGKAINRFIGSIAFVAAARTAFAVVSDPEDETGLRRLLLQVKNNIAAPQPGLAFRREQREVAPEVIGSALSWDSTGPVHITADQALAGRGGSGSQTAKDEAKDFLREVLVDGPVDVLEIEETARQAAMLSDSMRLSQSKPFRDAASALGIVRKRIGFGRGAKMQWSLNRA